MIKNFSIVIMLASVAITGCRTARITEATTTTTVVKDTTVRVEIPKDSARVEFPLAVAPDSTSAPTVKDTTIEVKSDLSMAVFTVKNGRASLKIVDGAGKKDSMAVTVKRGVRESSTSHQIEKVVEKKRWTDYFPFGVVVIGVVLLVYYFIPRRR